MTKFQAERYPLVVQVIDGRLCVYSKDFDCWITESYYPDQVGQVEILVREMWSRKLPSLAHRKGVMEHVLPVPTKIREIATETEDWLSTSEAARLIGVSRDTMRRLALSGQIAHKASPGGHRKFRRQDVQDIADLGTKNAEV